MQRKLKVFVLILIFVLPSIIAFNVHSITQPQEQQEKRAKFIIAGWEGFDTGIYLGAIYRTIDGQYPDAVTDYIYYDSPNNTFTVDSGSNNTLLVAMYLNKTYLGVSTANEGYYYFNLTLVISNVTGTMYSFTKDDFTSISNTTAGDKWLFTMEIYLGLRGFYPVESTIYTLTFNYKALTPSMENLPKIMYFGGSDPYSTFTFSYSGGSQTTTGGVRQITTSTNGYLQFFGYDEFVSQTNLYRTTWFKPTAMTGTYYFQLLGFAYQKTSLESNTHMALTVVWAATGLTLYWNTGNGNSPSSASLVATAPVLNHAYKLIIANTGTQTWIGIYDYNTNVWIYDANKTTANYDASSLYACFGQYCGGTGAIVGTWDDFAIYNENPYWHTINEVPILFHCPISEATLWALNGWYIVLGAGMVVFSTCFAAIKIKSREGGTDDILLFLVLFIFGWALIIGSVM